MSSDSLPRRSRPVLLAASATGVVLGSIVVALPVRSLAWAGLDQNAHPQTWQALGVLAAVWGVGYGLAASDPRRHWPLVLIGLLGKLLLPAALLGPLTEGGPNWRLATALLVHDLVWWVPFSMLLYAAFRANTDTTEPIGDVDEEFHEPREAMDAARTSRGWSLLDLSSDAPRLVVFLRHFGCTFTRETLAEIRRLRPQIEEHGASIVFVHMSDPAEADARFAAAGLEDAVHVSDPHCRLYGAFGLRRGSFLQMFGPRMWWRAMQAWFRGRHGIGALQGDGFRLPGAFLVFDGEILRAHRARDAADHPDYLTFARIRARSARWIRS